jgi:Tol biopolymer transport system component
VLAAARLLLPTALTASLTGVVVHDQGLDEHGFVASASPLAQPLWRHVASPVANRPMALPARRSAGPRVLYVVNAGRHGGQIATADADGTHRTLLTRGSQKDNPRWSNGGGRILYLDEGDEETRLFPFLRVMGSEGQGKRTLIGGPRFEIMDMAWGPAGGRVAVTMTAGRGNAAVTDVFMYSMRTGNLTRLHVNIPHRLPRSIDWSRDGKLLVFSALEFDDNTPDSGSQLYAVRPDGSGLRRITTASDGVFHEQPRWSPNGSQLVYHRTDEAGGRCVESVRLVAADGSHDRRVPLPCDMLGANWSPNGRRLLVETTDGDQLVAVGSALDGTRRRTVVRNAFFASWQPTR